MEQAANRSRLSRVSPSRERSWPWSWRSPDFPDLDLVIAFTGGSDSMASLFIAQRVYVSQYLLPAVRP